MADDFITQLTEHFVTVFPIGTELTAKDFGKFLIDNKAIEDPETTNRADARWHKYINERAAVRNQMNNCALNKRFIKDGNTPFQIAPKDNTSKNGIYKVWAAEEFTAVFYDRSLDSVMSNNTSQTGMIKRLVAAAEKTGMPQKKIDNLKKLHLQFGKYGKSLKRITSNARYQYSD